MQVYLVGLIFLFPGTSSYMKHFFLLGFLFFSAISNAEIFQCTDLSGKTTFKDKECNSDEVLQNKTDAASTMEKMNISPAYIDNAHPIGKNLLKNSTFEDKLVDWVVPSGASWAGNKGADTSGGLIIQSEIAPIDNYVHETKVSQCVVLGEGAKFKLKAQFKAGKVFRGKNAKTASYANRVNVIWYESLDCTTGGQFGWFIEPKNMYGWQDLSYENLNPAFQAKAAKITIVQNASYAGGHKGYWDNIIFAASEISDQSDNKVDQPRSKYTLTANRNYVKNGGFTYDLSGWHSWKAKWSFYGNKLPGSAKVTFEREKSMGTGALDQCVNIGRNTLFELGASVKKDKKSTQSGGGRIRVSWNEKENCKGNIKGDNNVADIKDIEGWQKLEVNNLVAPVGTQSAHIELIQSIAGPGKFSVFWDDVYFKAIMQ